MIAYLFDILFVLIVGGVGWFLARRGAVRAGMMLFSVLLASLFTMGLFEAAAKFLEKYYITRSEYRVEPYLRIFSIVLLFSLSLSGLLFLSHRLLPEPMEFGDRAENATRWSLGLLTGYLFAAFLLTAVQTFPAMRDFGGAFEPRAENREGPVMRIAPDYHYLAIVEHSVGRSFAIKSEGWTFESPVVPIRTYGDHWPSFVARYALWRESLEWQWTEDE